MPKGDAPALRAHRSATAAPQERRGKHAVVRALWSGHMLWIAITALLFCVAYFARIESPDRVYFFGSFGPLPPTCTFRSTVGIGCPGCGLTRSVISTAHGQLAAAWRYHPAGAVLAACLLASTPYRAWQHVQSQRGRAAPAFGKVECTVLVAAAVVSLLWWTARTALLLS